MKGRTIDAIMLILPLSEEEVNTHWILPKKGFRAPMEPASINPVIR